MNKLYIATFFWLSMMLYPSRIGNSQIASARQDKIKSVLDVMEQKKQKLFEQAFANQDTVKDLIKKKPKIVYLKEIKYVKVYRTIPIYIVEKDTSNYNLEDTLENDFIITPHIQLIPNIKKKRKFLGIF